MKCPPGHTPEQTFAIIERVTDVIAAKFSLPGFDKADLKQEAWLEALALLERLAGPQTGSPGFDATRGSLASLLYVTLSRRFLNRIRDTVFRADCPCKACFQASQGNGRFCQGNAEGCLNFRRWRERNLRKQHIAHFLDIGRIDDASEPNTRVESHVESDAEIRELLQLIDERLPVELRRTWLQLREGVKHIAKSKRQQVEEAILDIFDDAGVPMPQQLNPEGGDEPAVLTAEAENLGLAC